MSLLFSRVTENEVVLLLDSCLGSKHLDYVILPASPLLLSEVRFGDVM